jgi:hypothetical protein
MKNARKNRGTLKEIEKIKKDEEKSTETSLGFRVPSFPFPPRDKRLE